MMTAYEQHPLSAAFPAMSISELSELTMDIVNNGLRNPITLFEGMVLDGWHRYRACCQIEEGEVRLHTVEFPPELDPVAFVRSQNYHRRHLTAGQKAVAEVELSKWARVGNPNLQPNPAPGAELATVPQMAKAADVGTRTIEQAKVVVAAGLADAVKAGEVSVKRAAEVAKLPEPERQAAIRAPRPAPAPRPLPIRRPSPEKDGELDQLRARVIELEAQLAERDEEIKELAKLLQDTEEENKSFARVIEADDQVAAAMGESKRYRELARVTQERNNGLMSHGHALAKDAKRWMNKFLRLERSVKGVPADAELPPESYDPGPSDEDAGPMFDEPEPFVA